MLGGRMSNQDEGEVEDELAAMAAEMKGPTPLPNVPDTELPESRMEEQEPVAVKRQPERSAMLAS